MFFQSLLAITLVAVASAAPSNMERSADATTTVTLCTGSVSPPQGCIAVPFVSGSCLDLSQGGFSFLNKEISGAVVPGGFICTFFENAGCIASGTGNSNQNSEVVLTQGTWNLAAAPGLSGTENFNDLTSSITCSPL
ncbi:hypothetical protein FB45DRAFT_1009671 [Roridomyces roridus]|uniref:Uncharacterized protein n=1 Tax=Roridomyces roridus TaxID=1738132 RepID=A0AAD7B5C7_9AGAR|nr:hypothetical protein FB45DRAFT_1009671 [Roridomyces roridus]